jgi:hypothetical protein
MRKIGWQNGTLIEKAKVTIDGTVYEVEPEEYDGQTPLSAENFIQMENNVEDAIDEMGDGLRELIQGTILYEDSTGTTGDVTLSDNVGNYNFIKIFYKSGIRSTSIEIGDYTNKDIALPIIVTSGTTFVIITKIVRISGNKITTVEENQVLYHITNGYQFTQTDSMHIYKVIGYK